MTRKLEIYVDGVGLWASGLPSWEASLGCLRGEHDAIENAPTKPAPALLAATERRRAPDSVLLALEVASQACASAGRDPSELPSVFTCTYGDLAITDHMCSVLASDPRQLSPTKFHNSVHNAAAGYWGIATANRNASTALCAGAHSFGAGLLETAIQVLAENTAVLLAGYDTSSPATLSQVARSQGLFGAALVLAPTPGRYTRSRIEIALEYAALAPSSAPEPFYTCTVLQQLYTSNPMARCLPLLVALAGGEPRELNLTAAPGLTLHMEIKEWLN